MPLPEVLFNGSVKTVRGISGQSPYVFEFTDDFSIFDWGKMPDAIASKGEALSFTSNLFFSLLGNKDEWISWECPKHLQDTKTYNRIAKEGVFHHFISKVDTEMNDLSINQLSRYLAVKPVNILKPISSSNGKELTWDYKTYQTRPTNTLIPLEVIFRFDIPNGSSILERAKDIEYLKGIGLSNAPKEGDTFPMPIIEFSTKLETKDSYISYNKAKEIAGLNDDEFDDLVNLTTLLALRLKDYFKQSNIKLSDGKFEYAWDDSRTPMLVDVITPDELRISYKGKSLSKENIRKFYRDTKWHNDVKNAKDMAHQIGEKDWKGICINKLHSTPPSLDSVSKEKFSMIYISVANALAKNTLKKDIFKDAWTLDQLIESL